MCYSVVSMVSQGTEHTAPSAGTVVQGQGVPIPGSGGAAYGSPVTTTSGYSSYNTSPENTPEGSPCDYQYYDTDFSGKVDNLSNQMQNGYSCESPSAYSPAGSLAYSPSYPPQVQFNDPGSCESIQVCGNPSFYGTGNDPNNYGQVQSSNFSFFNYPQSVEGMCFSEQNSIIQQQICKICGDSASGNHFGVLSCEACKSFFRRSIRASTRYACRGNRNCIVQKHTRNRCQFCRLQKCVVNGMRKEAVQDERKPHSSNPSAPLRSKPAAVTSPLPSMSSSSRIYASLPNLKIEPISSPPTPPTPDASITALFDADVEPIAIKKVETIQMEDLISAMSSSFSSVSEWAKCIPAFVSLSLDDQVKLLKSSWCEHSTLKLAAQNGPNSEYAILANGVSCNKDQIQDTEVLRFLDRVSNEVSYWLEFLNVDKFELACLKGILLFNPDAKGLSPLSKKCIGFIQEQILQSLETRTKTMHPVSPQRFSKLLLRLAPLKAISLEVMQHMEVQRALGNNTKKDNLLLDFE